MCNSEVSMETDNLVILYLSLAESEGGGGGVGGVTQSTQTDKGGQCY